MRRSTIGFNNWRSVDTDPEFNLTGSDEDKLNALQIMSTELNPSSEILELHKRKIAPIQPIVQAVNSVMGRGGSFSTNVVVLRKELAKAESNDEDIDRMNALGDYFVGHECNAAVHSLNYSLDGLEKAITAVAKRQERTNG